MKKCFICIYLLLASILTGCSGNTENQVKIGLDMATRDGFLTSLETAAVKAASTEGIRLEVANANNDQQAQLAQIHEWAENGYAAALVVLCEENAAAQVLEKAGNMPVVFVNRRPDDAVLQSRANVIYIGCHEPTAGQMQGEYLSQHFQSAGLKSPRIAVLTGSTVNTAALERTQSAKDIMQESGLNPKYIYETDANWERAEAQKDFTAFLKTKPKIDAVLCANDEMAIGAADALAQSGYAIADIPFVGVDATAEGRAAIRDGRMDFTIYQDPVAQGAGAIEVAMTLLGGNQPEDVQNSIRWIPYTPVTLENIDQLFPND